MLNIHCYIGNYYDRYFVSKNCHVRITNINKHRIDFKDKKAYNYYVNRRIQIHLMMSKDDIEIIGQKDQIIILLLFGCCRQMESSLSFQIMILSC
jgi:lysozyme family protein